MTIFVCKMPSFCGYGLEAYGRTLAEAEKLAKTQFLDMKKAFHVSELYLKSFVKAMAYFGGTISEITVPSYDDFGASGKVVKKY